MRAKLIRVLVAGLLLLSLPLQGLARLTMPVCHASKLEAAAMPMPCHQQAHVMPNKAASTALPAAERSMVADDHHSKTSCSVCAPCCAGVTFNNTPLSVSIVETRRPATLFAPILFTSHLYPPLDRPPRAI